jgi:hypothetical protein
MAEEKSIPLILTVDGSKAIKTVGELKKGIADTRKELEKTEIGSKRFDELSEAVKKAEGRLGELNKQSIALKNLPGPVGAIATAFDGARTAVMRGVATLGIFKAALLATGIGVLLLAINTLMAYFKGTQEGAEKLRVIMAALGAVVGAVRDAFFGLSSDTSLIDKVKAAIELEGAMNRVKVATRELNVESAKSRADIKELNMAAMDVTKSTEERLAAAQKASVIEEGLMKKKVALAEENMRIIIEQNKLATSGEDAIEKAAQAEIELYNIREESLQLQTRLQGRVNTINQEAERDAIAKREAEKKRHEERLAELEKEAELRFRLAEKRAKNELLIDEFIEDSRAESAKERLELDIKRALEAEDLKHFAIIKAMQENRKSIDEMVEAESANQRKKEQVEAEMRRAFEAKEQEAIKAEIALRQQIRDSEINLIKDEEQQELERSAEAFQRRMDAIVGQSELERELRDALLDERLAAEQEIIDKYAEIRVAKQKAKDKELADADKALFDAKVKAAQAVGSALGALSAAIQGESEAAVAARKTLAVAEIAISTAVAIAGAIKTATSGSANPWEMIAAIAAGVATVIANITAATQILNSAQVGGGSAPAPSAPNVSAPSVNPVTTNTTQFGNTEQAELAPIQAYVVETQLTGSQNNVNQIESQATFGGG